MRWPWKKQTDAAQQGATPAAHEAAVTANTEQAEPKDDVGSSPTNRLTPREHDVFRLLIKGKKLKEIAEELGVKYSTVNTHQKSVYKKLYVNSRAECILRYGKPGKG